MKIITIIILLILSGGLNRLLAGQPMDSAALSKEKLYMSVSEAFGEPDKVHKLCLGGHELKEVPAGLEILRNLQEINISQNYIESLPDALCSLPALEELKLSTNELKTLPEAFGKLKSLKRLDLSANPKLDWKKEINKIARLENLVALDLSYNDLESIPVSFSNLMHLKELGLSGNKFTESEKQRIKMMLPNCVVQFD